MNEVFGTPWHVTFSLSWLLPIPAMFPESCRHKVYGYCVDSNVISTAGSGDDYNYDMDSELVPLRALDASSSSGHEVTLTSNLLQAHNASSPPADIRITTAIG